MSTDMDYHHKLAEFRRKAADGTITLDEMREAVALVRQGRVSAAESAAKSKAKTSSKAPVNASLLLSQLDNL